MIRLGVILSEDLQSINQSITHQSINQSIYNGRVRTHRSLTFCAVLRTVFPPASEEGPSCGTTHVYLPSVQ